ncbi:hypothetical protein, partial [Massilia genomosp. 1]|uniref:hypothetical protein n=1 Tax=Massilia genomosp. 1 TaxID=2609280 RepID=UPI001C9E6B34
KLNPIHRRHNLLPPAPPRTHMQGWTRNGDQSSVMLKISANHLIICVGLRYSRQDLVVPWGASMHRLAIRIDTTYVIANLINSGGLNNLTSRDNQEMRTVTCRFEGISDHG